MMLKYNIDDFTNKQKLNIEDTKRVVKSELDNYQKIFYAYFWFDKTTLAGVTLLYKDLVPTYQVFTRFHTLDVVSKEKFDKKYFAKRVYTEDHPKYKAGVYREEWDLGAIDIETGSVMVKQDYDDYRELIDYENSWLNLTNSPEDYE